MIEIEYDMVTKRVARTATEIEHERKILNRSADQKTLSHKKRGPRRGAPSKIRMWFVRYFLPGSIRACDVAAEPPPHESVTTHWVVLLL